MRRNEAEANDVRIKMADEKFELFIDFHEYHRVNCNVYDINDVFQMAAVSPLWGSTGGKNPREVRFSCLAGRVRPLIVVSTTKLVHTTNVV